MKYKKIIDAFRDILSERKEIFASYIYGSVLNSEDFEDIDVGLLVDDGFKPELMYEVELAARLEKKIKDTSNISKQVDVRVLNGRSLRFLFSVLKNSKLISSKDNSKRIEFEASVMKEYLDIKPHFEIYDNMRKLRYFDK